jgi:tyrosyl-tRNA synthetase
MSKSIGNSIGIDESPGVIFTKVLNVPDSAMRNYAELVTRWPQAKIDDLLGQVERGAIEMRTFKQQLAREIVSIFHGDAAADQAAEDARRMHEGEAPSDTPTFTLTTAMNIVDLLSEAGLVQSKGEARRLIQQSGVRVNGETVGTVDETLAPTTAANAVIQVGKRKFLRIVVR